MKLDQVADDVNVNGGKFTLMDLPYKRTDVEPVISRDTVDLHYGKHHSGYVDKLNDLIKGTEYEDKSLKQIIIESRDNDQAIFNNAGQNFNHIIYFQSLTPDYEEPSQEMQDHIEDSFDTMEKFKEAFVDAGMKRFGSGWVYLVLENGKIKFKTYPNADNPVGEDVAILAAFDVWEHSYYIDFRNKRPVYLKNFVDNLVNWENVASRL